VTLKIFDLLGREIATLVDQNQKAGRYQIGWDARHIASGIYFYTVQAGAFVETRKLLLLK
jgi:hypothetical protein